MRHILRRSRPRAARVALRGPDVGRLAIVFIWVAVLSGIEAERTGPVGRAELIRR
jgi:hypothetical protein